MSTYNNTASKVVNPETPFNINEILEYKHGKARIFNTVASLTNQHSTVYASQGTFGEFAGNYCRPWANHLINEIAKDGGFKLTKRAIDETLITDLPDEFFYYENRKILAEKYPAFRIWTPIVRERAIKAKAKNLTQLSSSIFINKNICLININNLENGASENNKRILNKIYTKKGNIEAKNSDASINNLQETKTPYRKKYTRMNLYDYEDTPHSAALPYRKYNPNKDRVHATKNGTKHFNTNYYFRRTEEEFEAERAEYMESIRYKSKLEDPNYNPFDEVHKVNAKIYERVTQEYNQKYSARKFDPNYDPQAEIRNLQRQYLIREKQKRIEQEEKRQAEWRRLEQIEKQKRYAEEEAIINNPVITYEQRIETWIKFKIPITEQIKELTRQQFERDINEQKRLKKLHEIRLNNCKFQ